jgi:hypothetical protein
MAEYSILFLNCVIYMISRLPMFERVEITIDCITSLDVSVDCVQDMFGALDRDTILSSLAMDRINRQRRRVDYVAVEAPPNGNFVGINELKTLLDHLSSIS